jgi:hypothetical protein
VIDGALVGGSVLQKSERAFPALILISLRANYRVQCRELYSSAES